MCAAATPAVSSRLASASAGSTGARPGVCPCNGRKLPARVLAGQQVRGVHRERGLAHPGHPADRVNPHHPAGTRRRLRQLLEFPLPPGEGGDIAGQRPRRRRDPASSGPARPFAAASNSARAGPIRPSASASSRAVSLRAVRLMPRSRSLTERGLSLAASASSSCVTPPRPATGAAAHPNQAPPAQPPAHHPLTAPAPPAPSPAARPARTPCQRIWRALSLPAAATRTPWQSWPRSRLPRGSFEAAHAAVARRRRPVIGKPQLEQAGHAFSMVLAVGSIALVGELPWPGAGWHRRCQSSGLLVWKDRRRRCNCNTSTRRRGRCWSQFGQGRGDHGQSCSRHGFQAPQQESARLCRGAAC